MHRDLRLKTIAMLIITPFPFAAMLFLSAWTLKYWQAWLFLAIFTIATTLYTVDLMINDPALLKRRMRVGPTAEKRPAQLIIMWMITAGCVLMFVVAGIDHRHSWSHIRPWIVLGGDGLVVLSYVIFHLVARENTFASATIELAEGHKVISTGLYSLVRHPMYSGALIFALGVALALGSLWALAPAVAALPALIWRIFDEEKFLAENLQGYSDYCNKVRYRLVPWVF